MAKRKQIPQNPPPLPTGDKGLDDLLNGGLPRGALVELRGKATTGKTALALQIFRNAKSGLYIDVNGGLPEGAFDGLDPDCFGSLHTDSFNKAMLYLHTAACAGTEIIVLDGSTDLTYDGKPEDKPLAWLARSITAYLSRLQEVLERGSTVLFIESVKSDRVVNAWKPQEEDLPSDGALMVHYASRVIMATTRTEADGGKVRVHILKSTVSNGYDKSVVLSGE